MEISKKFRKRLWLLGNIKRATKNTDELLKCYCSFLRPILDFCSNVYHPMINITLATVLEKLQLSALKIILGYRLSSDELLEKAELTTLQERRETLFRSFCMKTHNNARFRDQWTEEKTFTDYNLRKQNIIKEHHSRTERLYNSPLFALRRKLNDILAV